MPFAVAVDASSLAIMVRWLINTPRQGGVHIDKTVVIPLPLARVFVLEHAKPHKGDGRRPTPHGEDEFGPRVGSLRHCRTLALCASLCAHSIKWLHGCRIVIRFAPASSILKFDDVVCRHILVVVTRAIANELVAASPAIFVFTAIASFADGSSQLMDILRQTFAASVLPCIGVAVFIPDYVPDRIHFFYQWPGILEGRLLATLAWIPVE